LTRRISSRDREGRLLVRIGKGGRIRGETFGDRAIWSVVEQAAKQIGIERFGATTCNGPVPSSAARGGGHLEQIKFLLGHSSIQTTEGYLGAEQEIVVAVNDNLGL